MSTIYIDAEAIIKRMMMLERQARRLPADADWQTDPIAVEYRRLLCDWWQLPSAEAMRALYVVPNPFRNRLLTGKGIVVDQTFDTTREAHKPSKEQAGPFVRFTRKDIRYRDVIRRLQT